MPSVPDIKLIRTDTFFFFFFSLPPILTREWEGFIVVHVSALRVSTLQTVHFGSKVLVWRIFYRQAAKHRLSFGNLGLCLDSRKSEKNPRKSEKSETEKIWENLRNREKNLRKSVSEKVERSSSTPSSNSPPWLSTWSSVPCHGQFSTLFLALVLAKK